MGRRSWSTKRVQREPQCDLVVVRPTRCCPSQRRWELGKHAWARTLRKSSSPGRTQSRFMNDWVSLARSKFVLSSVAISSPIVQTQHVRNSQYPGSIRVRSTRTTMHKRTIDTPTSTMGVARNGGSVEKVLFTLLAEQADVLFAEEAVRRSVEQVLIFFRRTVPKMICGSG